MQSFKVILAALLLFLLTNKTFAQPTLSDKAFVSLLTCGPGDELYSVFGHTALRVHDPLQQIDVVYNYGTFDFDAPNFYLKFVKGDLKYFVSTSSYADFIYTYKYYNRDVYEQVLNLTPQQEQKIFSELTDVLSSDRKFYDYKFIHRNCTTMTGEIIELGANTKISNTNSDGGKTYREIIHKYLEDHFFENLGISLIFGAKTDIVLEKLFLPQHLLEGVAATSTDMGKLSMPVITVNKSNAAAQGTSIWNNYYTFTAILLALMIFSNKKAVYVSFFVIAGIMGIFFCSVGLYSFHEEITLNYNVLLINPLYLLLLFFLVKNNTEWSGRTIYVCLGMIVLYIVIMVNKPHLLLVLPIIALATTILIRLLLTNRRESSRLSVN